MRGGVTINMTEGINTYLGYKPFYNFGKSGLKAAFTL